MTLVNVWANAPDVPITVCSDARLHVNRSDRVLYEDAARGQAGWHVGIDFVSLPDLATQLRALRLPEYVTHPRRWNSVSPGRRLAAGEIFKLAINAHGDHGLLRIASGTSSALTVDTLPDYESDLRDIGRLVRSGGHIYLMGCNVAAGGGEDLLNALSGGVWRGAFVVGFTGVGFEHGGGQGRADSWGTRCQEPGMRDTGHESARSGQTRTGSHPDWNNLSALPWASYNSPSAVVSAYGYVMHRPAGTGRLDSGHPPG